MVPCLFSYYFKSFISLGAMDLINGPWEVRFVGCGRGEFVWGVSANTLLKWITNKVTQTLGPNRFLSLFVGVMFGHKGDSELTFLCLLWVLTTQKTTLMSESKWTKKTKLSRFDLNGTLRWHFNVRVMWTKNAAPAIEVLVVVFNRYNSTCISTNCSCWCCCFPRRRRRYLQ